MSRGWATKQNAHCGLGVAFEAVFLGCSLVAGAGPSFQKAFQPIPNRREPVPLLASAAAAPTPSQTLRQICMARPKLAK